jgi:hypothetical protein
MSGLTSIPRATLAAALAGSLLFFGAPGAEAKTKKSKKTAVAKPTPENGEKSFEVPIPINHSAKGVRIPIYNPEGALQMIFESEVAFRVDEQQLKMTDLKIATYTEGKPEMSIEMPNGFFNLKTRILSSTEPVTIRRPDLELTGSHMTFDTQTRMGKFTGPVRMLVYNIKTENAPNPPQEPPRE